MADVTEKSPRRFRLRGVKFLGGVLALYAVLFFWREAQTLTAMRFALEVLEEIVPILFVVVFLAGALHYWLDPKKLAHHLGEDAGWHAWLIALGAGILSHGPMYAWYPMIEDLRRHGLRDGYITAFFYARAVKVPLLPMMIYYFGWPFTLFLSLYIVLAAWIQGVIVEMIERRSGRGFWSEDEE